MFPSAGHLPRRFSHFSESVRATGEKRINVVAENSMDLDFRVIISVSVKNSIHCSSALVFRLQHTIYKHFKAMPRDGKISSFRVVVEL